ncbi:MAG: sigma-70 family RNA polymerase sigma factor [Oscillospiraceae bacterium]|nr:sigma-70 family RNA polymerase sigma factor [Oscillospiraceae bacterium]
MLKLLPKNKKPIYEDFYAENYDRVLHYVRGKIGNFEDAEDLVSEIFLYCYSHYESYDPEKSSIVTWLYLIVNSRVKNYYRDHSSFVDFESVADIMQDENIDLDEGVYLEQLHSALMKAIRTLPERQQKIVMMRYFQSCSGEEIAARLGTTPGNVRVLLSRALNKLSQNNDKYWKEFRNDG